MVESSDTLEQQIRAVKSRLDNARARVPKHDIPAALMAEIDELEDELAELKTAAAEPVSINDQIKQAEIQLTNAQSRMPKHDIPTALMQEIDELEEEIERLRNLRDSESS